MFPRVCFAAASFARHSQLALRIWIIPQPWVNLKHSTSAGNKSSDSEAFGRGSIVPPSRRAGGLPSLIELQLVWLTTGHSTQTARPVNPFGQQKATAFDSVSGFLVWYS
ncbi:hypothetical protein B0H11DRAFT_1945265 [Mycena galericulata]|nr:hypothetical protein B0H11DRAFT_1945265 [Mycena galericulata]